MTDRTTDEQALLVVLDGGGVAASSARPWARTDGRRPTLVPSRAATGD